MSTSVSKKQKTESSNVVFSLNKEQQAFFNYVYECIMKREKKIITVNSPGGTGKTHCVKEIVKRFPEITTILAPTNKAVSLFLPLKAITIHRFFNAKSDYDDNGELEFVFSLMSTSSSSSKQFHVVIIDECSMIPLEMVEIFLKYMHTNDCIMIFMGDICQLPPINEICSPVFKIPNTKHFNFTQNMRIKNSDLNEICDFFRRQFLHPENEIRNIPQITEKFKAIPIEQAIQEFRLDCKECVYLTWANSKKESVSIKVRKLLFDKNTGQLESYYASESLVFSGFRNTTEENYRYMTCDYCTEKKSCTFHKNLSDKISEQTSELIGILNIAGCIGKNSYRYYSNDIIEIKDVEKVQLNIALNHKRNENIDFYKIIDQNETIWLKPMNEKDKKTVSEYFKKRREEIKQIRNSKEKSNSWWNYYFQKKLIDPEIDYSYASTVHKAQGSQWKTVLVDLYTINKSQERKQLLYTAVSRAIDKVILTTN